MARKPVTDEAAQAAAGEHDTEDDKPKGPQTVADLFPQKEDDEDEAALLAELYDTATGKIAGDFTLPGTYELEIIAAQLLEHLTAYAQAKEVFRAAVNLKDRAKSEPARSQMNHHQLVAAILQRKYPGCKALADEIARAKVKQLQKGRNAFMREDDDK